MAKGGGGETQSGREVMERGRECFSFYFSFSFSYLISKANIAINAYQFLSCGLAKTMCILSGFLGLCG